MSGFYDDQELLFVSNMQHYIAVYADLRSDHTMQETQMFLEVAQPYSRAAKCHCWTSVFHTHQPRP